MSYAVLAAVEQRLEGRPGVLGGHYMRPWEDFTVAQVAINERPPLATLGSYANRRAIARR
jgi:hypothetical protein